VGHGFGLAAGLLPGAATRKSRVEARWGLCVLIALAPVVAAEPVTAEIDNTWVHVSRVHLAPHEKLGAREYPASVVVYLSDTSHTKNGQTAYFPPGARVVENPSDQPLEEVIIEFKPNAPRPIYPPITRDPAKLDPKYHTVDFENDRVRVLRTVLEPHIKSPMHDHPPYVVVYVTELHTTMALSDGKLVDNVRRKGEVAWRDAMHHSTENIGSQTAMEIQVELK
jgi:quercetin dioxygenase-like cupin family protein